MPTRAGPYADTPHPTVPDIRLIRVYQRSSASRITAISVHPRLVITAIRTHPRLVTIRVYELARRKNSLSIS